ncbi:MAG TPA: nucleotidyl transferase AbiEii/AbiGii toxin family protein [Beijerinckiaceae bacterium]|nr:nucleotidyl transferase AbiEii/AbiGii toxin family protein [Beijerinckiaceae bacterium]
MERASPLGRARFLLYGGTAIALRLSHRTSLDFDFFNARALNKRSIEQRFAFMRSASLVQEAPNTLVALVESSGARTKLSFFGGMLIGHINEPSLTSDSTLLIASPEDLLATKLEAILDRADVKDYIDIAALLRAGVSLERSLAGFAQMFNGEPATVLRAIGYFDDGDVHELDRRDRELLTAARDRIGPLPGISIKRESLVGSTG